MSTPEERYNKALDGLHHGNRHPQMIPAALAGREAGRTKEQIIADIFAESHRRGDRAISRDEVANAVAWALDPKHKPSHSRMATTVVREAERGFFARMRDAGERWLGDAWIYGDVVSSALYDLSPTKFPINDWREQAALNIYELAQDFMGYTFAGEQYSPRDARHVFQAEELCEKIKNGQMDIPPQIIANQLTGGKSWIEGRDGRPGHWSMATTDEVLHHRHAVIEFDGWSEKRPDGTVEKYPLPLRDQALFWIGCITEETMPGLRTLVYSGSKSIHAVVRLEELRDLDAVSRHAYELKLTPGTELTDAELWKIQWKRLEALLCSSDNKAYRLDMSCKDPTRQTRLAGHFRKDKGHRQQLLWLDEPYQGDFPD